MEYYLISEKINEEKKHAFNLFYKSIIKKVGFSEKIELSEIIDSFDKVNQQVDKMDLLSFHYHLVVSGKLSNLIYDGDGFWVEENKDNLNSYIDSLYDIQSDKDTDRGFIVILKRITNSLNKYIQE